MLAIEQMEKFVGVVNSGNLCKLACSRVSLVSLLKSVVSCAWGYEYLL